MTKRMTDAEIDAFLQQPLHAILATHASEGPPQLSPVWFLFEDGRLSTSILSGSAKHENLKRRRDVSLCIDGGRGDVRTVMLYGTAELRPGDDKASEATRWRIIQHYHEREEDAKSYYESVRDVPHVLLVLEPERVVSQDFRD